MFVRLPSGKSEGMNASKNIKKEVTCSQWDAQLREAKARRGSTSPLTRVRQKAFRKV